MSRSERLLALMQRLRLRRTPAPGKALAEELGVSLRTLYRDIASLKAQGARIEGEPGIGYALRPGYFLPPLMFTQEELEAIALGARFVANRTDGALRESAVSALRKISGVLPAGLQTGLEAPSLLVPPGGPPEGQPGLMESLRLAMRESRKLTLRYKDLRDRETERTVWPVSLGYFEQTAVLAAWCELRGAFRHFRAERIRQAVLREERIPESRAALLERWRISQGIPEDALTADIN